jgi:hypothetical protein
MTDNQDDMIESFRQGLNVVAVGSAGTGKTYVGLALALEALIEGRVNKIILIRSAVATRDIGFLPGTEAEKMAVYEQAFSSIVNELLGRGDAYQVLKQKGVIEFHSSSFLRGVTIKDAIIVVDEIANYNQHEMQTILSRVGDNARVILMGDFNDSLSMGALDALTLQGEHLHSNDIKAAGLGHLSDTARSAVFAQYRLQDAYELFIAANMPDNLVHSREHRAATHYYGPKGSVLDYILLSNEFDASDSRSLAQVVDYQTCDRHLVRPEYERDAYSTDHAPVWVELALRR